MVIKERAQGGFSLVELMVTVAIIGILTAIAIPNFMSFTARARQTEATSLLSNLYQAEIMFHAQWNNYYADWRDIGFFPSGNLHYILGFSIPYDPLPAGINYSGPSYNGPQPNPSISAQVVNNNNGFCNSPVLPDCVTLPTAYVGGGSNIWGSTNLHNSSPQSFVAAAAGEISGNSALIDSWIVTSQKVIQNITVGY